MTENSIPQGKTTIAPDVLVTIVKLTALGVEGVSRLAQITGGVNRFFKKGNSDGVRIIVENNTVFIDLYVYIERRTNVREICHNIQSQVTRAISEMVGMEVGRVNIHVEDIEYNLPETIS
jgi:uncharacterized alkaline shock family protein YloU